MHPIGLLFISACIVAGIVFILWNFVPSLREKMKGYSTVVEGLMMTVIGFLGQITGAIQDAQTAGYIPPQIAAYIPFVFLIYFVLKRFGTTTPIGQKE